MAESPEADITIALHRQLYQAILSEDFPIMWPGRVLDPEPMSVYLAVQDFFTPTQQVTFGDDGYNRLVGFLQVSVISRDAEGTMDAKRVAGEIISLYKRGTQLVENGRTVRIVRPPYISSPMTENLRVSVPVTVPWQCDIKNVT